MKPLKISNIKHKLPILRKEIRRNSDARYCHRLHGILLVAQGISCSEAAKLLGDAPRSVAYWVHRFEEKGLDGLVDVKRPGRPRSLNDDQLDELTFLFKQSPLDSGFSPYSWNGQGLSQFIYQKWGITVGTRQCQRILKKLKSGCSVG